MTHHPPTPQPLSRWERALLVVTLIASLALRLDALNAFLTIDEPTWAGRSQRFAKALASGDLAKTYQSEHPGVLTMWIGAAAARLSDGGAAPMTLRLPTEPEAAKPFPALTWWARRGVAILTWLGIVGLWALLRRLIGPRPALWAAILVALDPFYLAHSRVHHLDAILTTLMALSAASLMVYLQWGGHKGRRYEDGAMGGHEGRRHEDGAMGGHEGRRYEDGAMGGHKGRRYEDGAMGGHEDGAMGGHEGCRYEDGAMGGHKGRRYGGWGYLILSGAMAGLAVANKSPGVFLAGWAALVLAWDAWRGGRAGRGRRLLGAAGALALWGAVALAALAVAWPALRADPLGTVKQVLAGAERQGLNPHELSNFFWFAIRPDPGPAFYPVAWAFRASPWVFLGLIGLIAARRYRPAAGWGWAAALFILGYALFMTVSEKKFDRYLLPVFPWVDALAAAGGVGLMTAMGAWRARRGSPESPAAKAGRLRRACGARQSRPSAAGKPHDDASLAREGGLGNRSLPALAAGDSGGSISAGALAWAALIILVAQLALILPSRPYYLAYYNPLVGGGRAAQRVLLIGWGEGLNLAADYLNAKPSATSLHVAAQSSNEFGAFFTGHTTVLGERPVIEPDYFVLYAGQAQRLFVPEITGPLLEETPEHIVTVNGVEYARIYRNDFYQKETKRLLKVIEGQSDPDSTAVLVNWTASWPKDYGGAMYVECLATPGRDDYVLSALQRITERHKRIWLLLYPDASPDLDRRLKNWLAEYAVREQELRAGDVRAISYHLRPETRFIPARSQHEAGHLLNKQIRLLGYDLPQDAVTPGGEFYVRLYWQAIQFTDARYKVFVHLLGPDGQLVAQQDAEPQGGGWPTTHWLPGEMLVDDYALAVPADAPPGDYALAVGMYRLDNMERLPAVDSQGQRQPDDRIILVSGIENK